MRRRTRGLLMALLGVALALGLLPVMSSTALADIDMNVSALTKNETLNATTDIIILKNDTEKGILVRVAETTGETKNDYRNIGKGSSITLASGKQYQVIEKDEVSNQLRCTFKPTTHSFTYSASGATITAACGNKSCVISDGLTLTINAPELKVEGGEGSAQATVEVGTHWTAENGLPDVPSVVYYQGTEELPSAPTTAGNYRAQITVGSGETVVVAGLEYVIKPVAISSVTVAASPAEGGTAEASPAEAAEGEKVTLTATSADGYEFVNWTLEGDGAKLDNADSATTTLTMGATDVTVTANFRKKAEPEPQPEPTPAAVPDASVTAHVQRIGWMDSVTDGTAAGTTGKSRRMEALTLKLPEGVAGGIEYRGHVQRSGWENAWAADGAQSGTTGKSRRVEAVQIQLTGEAADAYDVTTVCTSSATAGWAGPKTARRPAPPA